MNKKLLLSAIMLSSISTLHAEDEHRQHDAHEHGAASLGLAQEGDSLLIELDSPAFNIIGFEHEPSNHDEHEVLDNAVAFLQDGSAVFKFPAAAQCKLVDVDVHSSLLDEDHHDDEHHEDHDEDHHDEHADEHHDDHDEDHHDEHADEHHDDHDEDHHDEHADEHHDDHDHEASAHSDIEVTWSFHCDNPESINKVEVSLFSMFEHLEDLDVDYILNSGQGSVELSPEKTVISF